MLPEAGLPAVCGYLVCHMTELPFTFHNDNNPRNVSMTPSEWAFSAQLVSWWTSFVSTGDPNAISGQAFQLPKWDPVARQNGVLNLTSTVEDSVEVRLVHAGNLGCFVHPLY